MMIDASFVDMIGILAGALVLVAFVPQIVRSYRTRNMKNISPFLMTLIMSGMGLWVVYGLVRQDFVIVGANTVGVALNATLLLMKFSYDKKKRKS